MKHSQYSRYDVTLKVADALRELKRVEEEARRKEEEERRRHESSREVEDDTLTEGTEETESTSDLTDSGPGRYVWYLRALEVVVIKILIIQANLSSLSCLLESFLTGASLLMH